MSHRPPRLRANLHFTFHIHPVAVIITIIMTMIITIIMTMIITIIMTIIITIIMTTIIIILILIIYILITSNSFLISMIRTRTHPICTAVWKMQRVATSRRQIARFVNPPDRWHTSDRALDSADQCCKVFRTQVDGWVRNLILRFGLAFSKLLQHYSVWKWCRNLLFTVSQSLERRSLI